MSPKAKNWTIGILCFLAGVIVTIIGFFILTIYVSFIQEHDADEEEPTVSMVDEKTMRMREPFELPMLASRKCEELSVSSIPVGSWWTDGDVYFKVLSNEGDTLYMVGTDLENLGMEITFVKQDDYTMRTYGSSVFAMYDSPAIIRQIKLADGSETQVIVSYYDEVWMRPQSILQRYRGKGLEKQQVIPQM
jgi:hypothetical protein